MTHLTEAGPLHPLDHKGDPLGLGYCQLGHGTNNDSTSNHSCCQARNGDYDYFITTTLR